MPTGFKIPFASALRAAFTVTLSVVLLTAFQLSVAGDADAKKRKRYKRAKISKKVRPNPKYAAYVIDAKTGKVLHARNAHAKRYPASLTKMMTLYLIFEDLKAGRIKKSSRLVMTKAGARRPPSKLGLRPGQSISMNQAIYSLVTKSANDVATAVGDKLAGSERAFAVRMTRKARQLGMNSTTFKNASGLTQRGQLTTAADMAKLGLALRQHFPREYKYFQTRVFKLGKRRYGNHNKLLGRVRGVDGIKTGYTRASGFNLVSSVTSKGRRIVAVVMGGRTGARRNAQMKRLINAYLPKASRGKSKQLIASARSSFGKSSRNAALVSKANKRIASRIKQAEGAKPKQVIDVRKKMVALASAATPTPVLRKSLVLNSSKSIDQTKTASIAKKASKGGWQIQIAASRDRDGLVEILNSVKRKNKRLLRNRTASTQRIKRSGRSMYRARFSGFSSQSNAASTCKALKKRRTDCLVVKG